MGGALCGDYQDVRIGRITYGSQRATLPWRSGHEFLQLILGDLPYAKPGEG